MNNPFFWLGISILLVAISLMALLSVAIFALQELARAARSAEKLLDTLNQELPATLRDLRLTGKEISGLTDDVAGSVQSARSVVTHVDQGITGAKVQAQKAQITTRSFFAGATAAFKVLTGQPRRRRSRPPTRRPAPQPLTSPPAQTASGQPSAPTSVQTSIRSLSAQPSSSDKRTAEHDPAHDSKQNSEPAPTSKHSQKSGLVQTHVEPSAAELTADTQGTNPVIPTKKDAEASK